jgi:hypothetical protein
MGQRLSASQVHVLLDDLCIVYGFCLPPVEQQRLEAEPPTDVDAFTDAVFVAEGMDPWGNLHLRRQIKKRIAQAFWAAGEPGAA